jgi:stage III sporulation protein AA
LFKIKKRDAAVAKNRGGGGCKKLRRAVAKNRHMLGHAQIQFSMYDDVLKLLPESDRQLAEEIRVRRGRSVTVLLRGSRTAELPRATLTVDDALARASNYSLHTAQESLRSGFITAKGGHRVGVCGQAIVRDGQVQGWKDVSSVNIRLCRQIKGVAERFAPTFKGAAEQVRSTLVISPPGGGKTTFLRDLIRLTSDAGVRIGVADERGEIAAMSNGVPQLDVGANTDVIEGVAKADAVLFLLRTMNPQVIATDEITAPSDFAALRLAADCGVALFATTHRANADTALFERVITITNTNNKRTYEVTACKST